MKTAYSRFMGLSFGLGLGLFLLGGCADREVEVDHEARISAMEERYENLQARYDDLEEKLEEQGNTVSAETRQVVVSLEEDFNELDREFTEVRVSTGEEWNEAEADLAQAMDNLEQTISNVWNDLDDDSY